MESSFDLDREIKVFLDQVKANGFESPFEMYNYLQLHGGDIDPSIERNKALVLRSKYKQDQNFDPYLNILPSICSDIAQKEKERRANYGKTEV